MKQVYTPGILTWLTTPVMAILLLLPGFTMQAQNCPANANSTLISNPNTFHPGQDALVTPGATTITLGPAGYGTTNIKAGDLLLLIQMQGAQINAANTSSYGDGVSGGAASGYLSNSQLIAGNMEYVVAKNAVPIGGGTLNLLTGVKKTYKNADFSTDGQYRYQVVRVGLYYNLQLNAAITAPAWNGNTGGLVVLSISNKLNFNGQTISAAGAGFRGGAARQLYGGTGGASTDFVTLAGKNYNGSKGEGIAGTPQYINNNGLLQDNTVDGYPNGSSAAGAPGNAGGGGTDGNPASNNQNSGGGGGANGGAGGKGGNSWSSNLASGGQPGALFNESSSSRFVMGGGGGAGSTNNGTGVDAAGFSSSGAAGGGIVMIVAKEFTGTGTVNADGGTGSFTVFNDGSGGGGAGGTVLVFAEKGVNGITVSAKGGAGGSNSGLSITSGTASPHGPGGGGSGGVVYSSALLNAASTVTGGQPGTTTGGINYNAAAGSNGKLVQNIVNSDLPSQGIYCILLDVRFLTVQAALVNNQALIKWEVTAEKDIAHYVAEKSTDGIHFVTAGTVLYAATTTTNNNYSFTDNNLVGAVIYYRIKQVAVNGSTTYSTIVNIKTGSDKQELTVMPNPAKATATVSFTAAATGNVNLRLFNYSGILVWQKKYHVAAGRNAVVIDNITTFPNGTYVLQHTDGLQSAIVKVQVAH